MGPSFPVLSGRCAPFRLKFGCVIDLRWNLDYVRGFVEHLPRGFAAMRSSIDATAWLSVRTVSKSALTLA